MLLVAGHVFFGHDGVDRTLGDADRAVDAFIGVDGQEVRTFAEAIHRADIDCAVCIPECPVNAILPEEDVPADQIAFIKLNADLAKHWPSITKRKTPLPDADDWKDRKDKLSELIR